MSKVAVIGLGEVGLPVMVACVMAGHDVVGIERSHKRIVEMMQCNFNEPGLQDVLCCEPYIVRRDIDYAHDCDIVIICVDIPLGVDGPDFISLENILNNLSIKDDAVLIIESTLPIHGMKNIVLPRFPNAVNCPERLSSGHMLKDIKTMARVIGCQDERTAEKAKEFYSTLTDGELVITDCATAEVTKLVENADRNLHITFANELARQCYNAGVDFWEVRDIVNRQRKRQILMPGISIGGHCLEKDLQYLAEHNAFLQDIRMANKLLHFAAYNQIIDFCDELPQKILILGYTYRENTTDTRNSPTERLASILKFAGIKVSIYDPHVTKYAQDIFGLAQDADLCILAVAHIEFLTLDYARLGERMRTKAFFDCKKWVDKRYLEGFGFRYGKLGDGKIDLAKIQDMHNLHET